MTSRTTPKPPATSGPVLALTADQAAAALNMPPAIFDEHVAPALHWLELDGHRVIPVTSLQTWLHQTSQRTGGPFIRTKA